jgi:hypothetical protein
MEKQEQTKLQSIGDRISADLTNFEYSSLGILLNSYAANGIHVANRAMYLELYEKELQIAYNNGRASVISELSEG